MTRTDKHTMGSNPITLVGNALEVGQTAPDFTVLTYDLTPYSLKDTKGVRIISVVPSLDTGVCQMQTKRFNDEAAALPGVQILTISMDLPFAQKRFAEEYDVDQIGVYSDHKDADFGTKYGFLIEELRLLNRGIVVIDADGVIRYIEYVTENHDHPDYDKALEVAKGL